MKSKFGLSIGALALLTVMFGSSAQAAFIMNITQSGANVVGTGSGSINLTALINEFSTFGGGAVSATFSNGGSFVGLGLPAGPTVGVTAYAVGSLAGPATFGAGGVFLASSGSGSAVDIDSNYTGNGTTIYVPTGYVSGSALSDTSTWTGTTIAGLGLTSGTYVYTWGSGASADSFTLNIGAAQTSVPEPTSLALMATAAIALILPRLRKVRKTLF